MKIKLFLTVLLASFAAFAGELPENIECHVRSCNIETGASTHLLTHEFNREFITSQKHWIDLGVFNGVRVGLDVRAVQNNSEVGMALMQSSEDNMSATILTGTKLNGPNTPLVFRAPGANELISVSCSPK